MVRNYISFTKIYKPYPKSIILVEKLTIFFEFYIFGLFDSKSKSSIRLYITRVFFNTKALKSKYQKGHKNRYLVFKYMEETVYRFGSFLNCVAVFFRLLNNDLVFVSLLMLSFVEFCFAGYFCGKKTTTEKSNDIIIKKIIGGF